MSFAGGYISFAMNKYFYDFHIHSCLSPCGDNDMTPENIAGMASLKGLNILALTDHNSCKNCPAFFAACKKNGIIPIAGMELTTAEDIHIVTLFESLDDAMRFDERIQSERNLIENRIDIFGDQIIYDKDDKQSGIEKHLLPNATNLSIEQGFALAKEYGGFCYPAHIDREANGIVATLGTFPDAPDFCCVEYRDGKKRAEYEKRFPNLKGKTVVVSSDAHYLWDINEAENFLVIDDEPYSGDKVRKEVFKLLKGGEQG